MLLLICQEVAKKNLTRMGKSPIFVSKSKTMKKKCENCKFWSFKASGDSDTSIGVCLNEKTNEQVTMMSEGALARFFVSGDSEWEKSENAKVIATSLRFRNDFSCENYEMDFNPDWDNAPKWAKYWAVDESGEAFWYEIKPKSFVECWNGERMYTFDKSYELKVFNWRDSLRSRPTDSGKIQEQ